MRDCADWSNGKEQKVNWGRIKVGLFEDIKTGKDALAVIGLGYVGLPLALEFAEKTRVIGFDINKKKIDCFREGIDVSNEVGGERLKASTIYLTSDEVELKKAKFFIVAVPTPINKDKTPDLRPLIGASEIVGRNICKDSIVVFESTVYPGATEEVCIPTLEKLSGLKCGSDFAVGYSPERINPGDRAHNVTKITKVVSAVDKHALEAVADIYSLIVEAGIYKAENIKVAEAAKVIENAQRDINIAFVNELSLIFNKMGIETGAVLRAAGTKWNFLQFRPGLVGGHCIGVDPYYLTYKAEQIGYHPQVILAGRRINDDMGRYIAENVIKLLIKAGKNVKGSRVLILGLTFKENVADIRNTKVVDIVKELTEYGLEVHISDPIADKDEVFKEYGLVIEQKEDIEGVDVIIFAVCHDAYRSIDLLELKKRFCSENGILVDVKGFFDSVEAKKQGFLYWSL
jgi:UDP-N-acetyl-D-glucosamine/UDP-N-acetyl-D-galactosamine dehydrogenase